jgi:hypothetical protein
MSVYMTAASTVSDVAMPPITEFVPHRSERAMKHPRRVTPPAVAEAAMESQRFAAESDCGPWLQT